MRRAVRGRVWRRLSVSISDSFDRGEPASSPGRSLGDRHRLTAPPAGRPYPTTAFAGDYYGRPAPPPNWPGAPTLWAQATASTATIPLGALAALIPAEVRSGDPLALIRESSAAVRASIGR